MMKYDGFIDRYDSIKYSIYRQVLNGEISVELGNELIVSLVYSITEDDFMRYFIISKLEPFEIKKLKPIKNGIINT